MEYLWFPEQWWGTTEVNIDQHSSKEIIFPFSQSGRTSNWYVRPNPEDQKTKNQEAEKLNIWLKIVLIYDMLFEKLKKITNQIVR